jgi:hypothetical protein
MGYLRPILLTTGAGLMAIGLTDAVTGALSGSHDAHQGHVVVLAAMVVLLVGVIAEAFGSTRPTASHRSRSKGASPRHAYR